MKVEELDARVFISVLAVSVVLTLAVFIFPEYSYAAINI